MPRKYVIISLIITGVFLAVLFGVTFFVTAMAYSLGMQHAPMSEGFQSLVRIAYTIQRLVIPIAFGVTGGGLVVAWQLSRIFARSEVKASESSQS